MDVLVRYQTTLDRPLSKFIGELMVLKANEVPPLPASAPLIQLDKRASAWV